MPALPPFAMGAHIAANQLPFQAAAMTRDVQTGPPCTFRLNSFAKYFNVFTSFGGH